MEQSEQATDSLYDFIYIDDHKSKILLAQLEVNGILTQIKNRIQEEDSSGGEFGIDSIITLKKDGKYVASESIEHSFDTSLSIYISLLSKLKELNRIKDDINNFSVGDLVIFKGEVNILDLSTIQKLAPSLHLFLDNNKGKGKEKLITEIIKVLPATIQFTFKNCNNYRAWMSLPNENMLISSADLMLKYGDSLDGEWAVLGILDSKPNEVKGVNADNRDIAAQLGGLSAAFKKMLGKDPDHFGITPLMIFRKIN